MVRRGVTIVLGGLLTLFIGRVAGQLLVATMAPRWLPPMNAWYSGLIPYGPLLIAQILIIGVFGAICRDFYRGAGYFFRSNRHFGRSVFLFGWVYLAGMILRYAIRMGMYPDERWTGGCIPIFFHWVLAGFILVFAGYHRYSIKNEATS